MSFGFMEMAVPDLLQHPPPWIFYPSSPVYVPRLTHTDDNPPPQYDEPRRPDATVIIPTRGNEPFLGEVLAALEGERFGGLTLEVLVVDDPEFPSSTRDVVFKFQRYRRLSYVEQDSREGAAGAMNQGARIAASDVLVFLDADLVPEPGLIREMLGLLRTCDVVSTQHRFEVIGWSLLSEPFIKRLGFVTSWGCAMRRSTLAKYGWWENDYLWDVEFWLRARGNGCKVRFAERRVRLKRRIHEEFRKFFHVLRHIIRSPHSHPERAPPRP